MKPALLCIALSAVFVSALSAENPPEKPAARAPARQRELLPPATGAMDPAAVIKPGEYLLIVALKDGGIDVSECTIVQENDALWLKFASKQMAIKPLRLIQRKGQFQFTLNPDDYDDARVNDVAFDTWVYRGFLFPNGLLGTRTHLQVGSSTEEPFRLYPR